MPATAMTASTQAASGCAHSPHRPISVQLHLEPLLACQLVPIQRAQPQCKAPPCKGAGRHKHRSQGEEVGVASRSQQGLGGLYLPQCYERRLHCHVMLHRLSASEKTRSC